MTTKEESFPKVTYMPCLAVGLCLIFSLPWKDSALILISQRTEEGGNLSDCWVCHQKH